MNINLDMVFNTNPHCLQRTLLNQPTNQPLN